MTRREFSGLFSAWREIMKLDFWFCMIKNPKTGIQLIFAATYYFAVDIIRILIFPENVRNPH